MNIWRIIQILFPFCVIVPLGIYLYHYLRRSLLFWGCKPERLAKGIAALGAMGLAVLALNLWGIGAIVVLYLAGVSLVLDLIYRLTLKRIKAKGKGESIYRSGLIPVFVTLLLIAYGYFHMTNIVETGYTVETQKNVGNYRVALITDLHFGTSMNGEKLREVCGKITKTDPDLVVLGGDLVDENTTLEQMQEAFRIIGSTGSKYGIYYVYGNHDRSRYRQQPNYTEDQLAEAIEAGGIHILADEAVPIGEDLILIGREDASVRTRKSGEELTAGLDSERFLLLADHQPVELKQNASLGIDLQLSGHTHGGQIWPLGVVNELLGINEMNAGQKAIGAYQVIVSTGIAGWGYPIKTEGAAEYVIVDIKGRLSS